MGDGGGEPAHGGRHHRRPAGLGLERDEPEGLRVAGDRDGVGRAVDPRQVVELAVWGMLPKNRLSRKLIKKLKVYAGPDHPHTAQQPQAYEITQIAQ